MSFQQWQSQCSCRGRGLFPVPDQVEPRRPRTLGVRVPGEAVAQQDVRHVPRGRRQDRLRR